MLEQVARLEDGDYEQSAMVQLFLDCVDETGEQHTVFVSCRERPMHEDDQQSQTLRVVDPILDMTGATTVDMVSCGDAMVGKHRFEGCVVALEGDHVQRSGNVLNKRKTEVAYGCKTLGIWSHRSRLRAHTRNT